MARTKPPAIVFAAVALCGAAALTPGASAAEFVPGEVLVGFEAGTAKQDRAAAAARAGGRIESRIAGVPRLALVDLAPGAGVREAMRTLNRLGSVSYAEPNYLYRLQAEPDDSFYELQWGLDNEGQFVGSTSGSDIGAEEAWGSGLFPPGEAPGDPDVTIAVIDTGIDTEHPDLAPNLWVNEAEATGGPGVDDDLNGRTDDLNGWNFVDEDANVADVETHGSHVAGIAAAAGDNSQGVSGVNWEAGLMALRAAEADGTLANSDVTAAIAYADQMGARVVNASFVGEASSLSQQSAIAAASDVLFVTAAGNGGADGIGDDNDDVDAFPCDYELPNVLCVASTTFADGLAPSSNFGNETVDLAAPGRTIESTLPGDWSWASMGRDGTFETSLAGWSTGGTNDTWTRAQESATGGLWSLTDSPGADYLDGTDSYARTSSPVPLTGYSGCRVEADVSYDLAAGDALKLEGSTSGDDGDWAELGELTGSGSVVGASADLDPDFFGAPSFYLRFRLVSDEAATADGVHIDNVFVRCDGNYGYKSGTSMAAPYVSGAAALLLDADPTYTVAELRAALLGNVDKLASLRCVTWSGGRLDLAAALLNGPPAQPLAQDCPPPVIKPPDPPAFDLKAAIKRCKRKFRKGTKGRRACVRKARRRAAA